MRKSIAKMKAASPLKPLWGGLPSFGPDGQTVEPPSATEEEKEIHAVRTRVFQFLKEVQRFVNDYETVEQKAQFEDNGLVRVARFGSYLDRYHYSKQDCMADLRSLLHLLPRHDVAAPRTGSKTLAAELKKSREAAGQTQEQAAAEITIDVKAYGEYERDERRPRKNLEKLEAYIKRHSR